jgi:hypothetical protein
MNRLFALLREVAWSAVGSIALAVVAVVVGSVGGELPAVVGLGSASIALAVLNLRA